MMQLVDGELTAMQRILGMTIASMPLWIVLAIFGAISYGAPTESRYSWKNKELYHKAKKARLIGKKADDYLRSNIS